METEYDMDDGEGNSAATKVQFEDVIIFKDLVNTFPNSSIEEKLMEIKNIPYNDGDILLCTFPKTGTHWMYNLINILMYDGPMEKSPSDIPLSIHYFPSERYLSRPSPKVIHSHLNLDRAPTSYLEKGKIVLVVRNPKDTAVSCYKFMPWIPFFKSTLKWNYFISNYLTKTFLVPCTYPEYLNSMQKAIRDNKDLDIHVVYYEDLKKNGLQELQKLQKHLGYNHSDERLQAILDRCTIKRLGDDANEGKTDAIVTDTNGKQVLYRKGEIGDWRNHFTVAQSEDFDAEWEALMKDSMFHFQYT